MANKKEIQAQLEKAGIEYPASATKAELEKLLPATGNADSEPVKPAAALTPPTGQMNYEQKRLWTKQALDAQPKVSYRIPLGHREKEGATEVVVINGYSYIIKKGVRVEVPESVADILDERFSTLESLGKTAGVDGQDVRYGAAQERASQAESTGESALAE